MSDAYVAGLDFGTFFTVVATAPVDASGQITRAPEYVRFGDESRLSSAVGVDTDGNFLAGPQLGHTFLYPERVERTPKRCLALGAVPLGGRMVSDKDLIAAVLNFVFAETKRCFDNASPRVTRITYPAQWEDERVSVLLSAAKAVGIERPETLQEPVAAGIALAERGALTDIRDGDIALINDVGGGTTDVSLLRRQGSGFVIEGEPGGDERLGGEDVDDALVRMIAGMLPDADQAAVLDPAASADVNRWRRAAAKLRIEARRAKEALATTPRFEIPLDPPFTVESVLLTAPKLNEAVEPFARRAAEIAQRVLKRNGVTADQLSAVCMVGGSSRLAMVGRVLAAEFPGCHIVTHGDPKGLVAYGAALLGATRAGPGTVVKPGTGHREQGTGPHPERGTSPHPEQGTGPERGTGHWWRPLGVPPPADQEGGTCADRAGVRTMPEEDADGPAPAPGDGPPAPAEEIEQLGPAQRGSVPPTVPPSPARLLRTRDYPVGRAAGVGLAEMVAPGAAAILRRWLVAPDGVVAVGSPVAELEVATAGQRSVVCAVSQHAGVVLELHGDPGDDIIAANSRVVFDQVYGWAVRPTRPISGCTGLVVTTSRCAPGIQPPSSVSVELARTVHVLWWSDAFFFEAPAGRHLVVVKVAGGRAGPIILPQQLKVRSGKVSGVLVEAPRTHRKARLVT